MLTRILFMVFILAVTGTAYSQSAKKKKKDKRGEQTGQPTSLSPYFPQADYTPEKAKSRKAKGVTYNAEERYYARMEEVAKQKLKAEKELAKPQYSDPSYFGHKRPPKKHKPGKMKYCKVCGIRH